MPPPEVLPRRSRRLSQAIAQLREARLVLITEYRITEAAELKRLIDRLSHVQ